MLQQRPHISIDSVTTVMWVNLFAAFTSEFPNYVLSCSTASHSQLEDVGLPYTHLPSIRCIPLSDPFEPWNARLYWRKDRPLTEHEQAFRDYVERFYQDLH